MVFNNHRCSSRIRIGPTFVPFIQGVSGNYVNPKRVDRGHKRGHNFDIEHLGPETPPKAASLRLKVGSPHGTLAKKNKYDYTW